MNALITRIRQQGRHNHQRSKSPRSKKRKSPSTSAKMFVMDAESGEPRLGTPKDCVWWLNHVTHPELMTKRMHMKFRRRFRMPFKLWQELVEMMNQHILFQPWRRGSKDAFGKEGSPIEILSLGALRYLGRKCTFDCLEEATFISKRTHERFFKKFIEFGETHLHSKFVIAPTTVDETKHHMHEMGLAGFNGSIGSMDATQVTIENCRFGFRNIHLGHKLSKIARTYNIIVNHRRRILSSTSGHPSRWNDKTLILFDSFIEDIRSGKILSENEFTLYERAEVGTVVSVTYKGVWIQVDNGYLDWSITIPPFKYCGERSELRFS